MFTCVGCSEKNNVELSLSAVKLWTLLLDEISKVEFHYTNKCWSFSL